MPNVTFRDPADALAELRFLAASKGARSAPHSTYTADTHRDQLSLMPPAMTAALHRQPLDLCRLARCRAPGCRRCLRLRARIAAFAADGVAVEAIAVRLGIPAGAVQRHLESDARARPEKSLKIANRPLRDLVERRRREDPGFTLAELARRAGLTQTHLERVLGYKKTSDCWKTDRHNNRRFYEGAFREQITTDHATRIARALDVDPYEVEGL